MSRHSYHLTATTVDECYAVYRTTGHKTLKRLKVGPRLLEHKKLETIHLRHECAKLMKRRLQLQYLSVTVELAQGLDHTLVDAVLQHSLGQRSTEAVSGYHSSQQVLLHGCTVLTVDCKQHETSLTNWNSLR